MDQSVTRTQYDPAVVSKFERMSAGAALVMLLLLLRGDRGGRGASVVAAGSDVKSSAGRGQVHARRRQVHGAHPRRQARRARGVRAQSRAGALSVRREGAIDSRGK